MSIRGVVLSRIFRLRLIYIDVSYGCVCVEGQNLDRGRRAPSEGMEEIERLNCQEVIRARVVRKRAPAETMELMTTKRRYPAGARASVVKNDKDARLPEI